MYSGENNKFKKSSTRFLAILLTIVLAIQMLGINITALGASPYAFAGYDNQNISASTFGYAYSSGTTVSGRDVTMDDDDVGEAIGYIVLDDPDDDISDAVDLGGLEIDFSTTTVIAEEGVGGALNDVPKVEICFCSDSNYDGPDGSNVIFKDTLEKSDPATAGSEKLLSDVSIPVGTRAIFINLTGTNTESGSDNTVEFQSLSLIIGDAAPPSCTVSYDDTWTNGSVTVTVEAADSDSGLDGIYIDGAFVTATSPHTFTVTENNTTFTAYSRDLAGKVSDTLTTTIDNIDTAAPATPGAMTLSHDDWTNTDVTVSMGELVQSGGSPERYIYQIGSGEWQDFTSPMTYSADGISNISIAVADEAGNDSDAAQDIIYIDKQAPSIDDVSQTVSSGSCTVDVDVSDAGLSGIDALKYATGSRDASYFATGGNDITGGTFTVSTGGTFTIFVSDAAGNYDIGEYEVNTAPNLDDITEKSVEEDGSINVAVSVSDNETARQDLVITANADDTVLVPSITVNQSADAVSLDIAPAADCYGITDITIEITDAGGESVSTTFTLTVTSQNDPPVAVDDEGITVAEDASVTIDVLANDHDNADSDDISISDPGTPAHGTTEVSGGMIVYTPDENYNGSDSFAYTISDGKGGSDTATVSITVTAGTDAPIANDDSAETTEDNAVTISVLTNDTDADLDDAGSTEVLTVISAEDGAHGTTSTNGTTIVYTPDAQWSGTDTFTYTIQDTAATQSTATVTVTVTSVNDAPQFAGLNTAYTINEDNGETTINFSITDVETAADSLMLQAASSDNTILPCSDLSVVGLGDDLDAVSLVLTTAPDMYGELTIHLTLGDGFDTTTRDITLTVDPVNDAPDAHFDTLYFDEDTTLTIKTADLLLNDSDIEGDAISFSGIATTTSVGTLTQVDADTYEYNPPANYDGTDSFTYYVTDGTDTAVGTCELIARSGNDAPVVTIAASSYSTNEDTSKADITFTISDEETDAEYLIVKGGSSDTALVSTDGIAIINNGDGTCTMSVTPMPDANGTCTVTVTVSDGDKKSTDEFSFVIAPVQDAPVAVDDDAYIPLSGQLTFAVLENDRDVDGDSLTVTGYDDSALPGQLTFDEASQQFTYRAQVGETGISTFTYAISDGNGGTDTATVTLDVHAVTHAPVISGISNQYINEDSNTGNIPFSVSDVDFGDVIMISVSSSDTTLLPEKFSENIIVTDNGDGTYYLYLQPAADENGTATVTVTATDSANNTDTELLTLRVYAQNDAPTAVDDAVSTNEDTNVVLPLLINDSDPENDALRIEYIEWPAHGTLIRSGSTYTYDPYSNWNGTEVLTYKISDGCSIVSAEVTITVDPVNDAPVARSDWAEVENTVGASVTINVIGNDYDVDSASYKISEIIEPEGFKGDVVDNGNGTLTYTRLSESDIANGRDDFQYTIVDLDPDTGEPLRTSNTATVYIGIDFVTELTAYSKWVYCHEDDGAFIIDLTHYIENPNSVDFDTAVIDTTTLGTFEVVDDAHLRFTPAPNAFGDANITYSVSESAGGSEYDTGELYLHVYPVNDAPVITSAPDAISCDEDDSTSFTVTFSDVDDIEDNLYVSAYGTNRVSGGPIPLGVSFIKNHTDGSALITVTPGANAFGELDIVVRVSDGMLFDSHTLHMSVDPVDDAPIPENTGGTLYEDTDITFGVITSDCDVDGDSQTIFIAEGDQPDNGIAAVNGDGTITYTPDANYFGTDTFTYSVKDNTVAELTSTATATMTVIPINDPPVITDLDYYYTTNEDTAKVVTLTVTDVDNDLTSADSYTITSDNQDLITDENISIAHVSGTGMAITLVPEANEFGVAVISITATDGTLSDNREFQLTVLSVNDIPVANDDTASANEQVATPATETEVVINVLANDSDIEDTELQIASIDNITEGRVVNNENGTVTYYVDGDHSGTETFDYTVVDDNGATDTATVTVTIVPMNDPPLAEDDEISITEDDQDVAIDVLANDSDTEGNTLTILNVSDPAHGTATTDGSIVTYTPDLNYFGDDSMTYTLSDGNGGTDTGLVSIDIAPENDAPTLVQIGVWEMDEDTTESFNFVVGDVETPDAQLIVEIVSQNETVIKTTSIVLSGAQGTKTITVTPELHQHGTVPIRISVTDGAATTTKTFNILVKSVNDAPVISTPPVTTEEDTAVGGSASATDVENDELTYSKGSDPEHGTVVVNADGTYTYTPEADFNGTDSFNVVVSDGADTAMGSVVVTVKPVNDAPEAQDGTVTTDEDTAVNGSVSATDVDGDTQTYAKHSDPSHGTVVVNADGSYTYTPSLNYNGTDRFEFEASDGNGGTDTAAVTVTIGAVNDAPTADDAARTIQEDASMSIPWATITDDVDGDSLTVQIDTGASNGTASVVGANITYAPNANWHGTDSFTYTATDGEYTDGGTITVTVQSVNDPPQFTVVPETMNLIEDSADGIGGCTVTDIETADGDLVVTALSSTNYALVGTGDVTLGSNGDGTWSVVVDPNDNKNGSATITLRVTDGEDSATCTFVVNVSAVNDAPSGGDDSITTAEDTAKTFNAVSNDDIDLLNEGDTMTITAVGTPSHGTATDVGGGNITYTPSPNYNGDDSFTYTVEDAVGESATFTVSVAVSPVNDAPVITPESLPNVTTNEDTKSESSTFTVTDIEDDDSTLTVTIEAISNTGLVDTITLNPATDSARTFTITPSADQNGTATIRVTVTDANGGTDTDTFSYIVSAVNDAPSGGDDAITTAEDTAKTFNAIANDDIDTQHEGDTLSITAVNTPSHGSASGNGDGTITYTPAENYYGDDSFTYTVQDAAEETATVTVSVTVDPVNDAPEVALVSDDSPYTVDEGSGTISIEFIVTDVDNDTTCGTSEVTISKSTNNNILVRDGLEIRDNAGESRYIDVTPYRKWNGTAVITITANDGELSGSTSFTYIVNSVNDAPVGDDVSAQTAEDTQYTIAWDTITDDEDIITNGDTLSVEITSAASHGTAAVSGGDITYMPDENWNGTDSFVYTVSDNHGATDTGTITVEVTPAADTPVADADSATTAEDTVVSIDVLDGDTDVDSNAGLNTHPDAHPELQTLSIDIGDPALTAPMHGSIVVDSGQIVYTPNADYNGSDSFTYNVVDNTGRTHEASVSVTISQVNDAPVANADAASKNEDNAVSIDVLGNDTDVDQIESLNADPGAETITISIDEVELLDPLHGSIAVVGGQIVYTPDSNWFGMDTFEYNADDGEALTTGTVTVTIMSVNDLPVFTLEPDDMVLTEDLADGVETLSVTDIETADADLVVTATSDNTSLIGNSDITITHDGNGNRTVTVDPKDDQNGSAIITVRVTDGNGGYNECTFNVSVTPVNDDPRGGDDTATTSEDTATTIAATANDDVDETTNPGDEDLAITAVDDPANGTAAIVNGGKDITYTPDSNWNGTESFGYTVEDAQGVSVTFTITVEVTPVPDTPVADADNATTAEDTAVSIDVLDGDTDIDSDAGLNTHPDAHPELQTLSIDIGDPALTAPIHGSIVVDGGQIVYTPNANYNGTDSFTYNVVDNTGRTHEASVSVTISQVNDAPVPDADSASTPEDTAVSIDVLDGDTDIDQDMVLNTNPGAETITISIDEVELLDPLHGDIAVVGGQIVYTPDANWFGTDTFEYNADDGEALAAALVTVTVGSVNDLPVFTLTPDDMALTEDLADGVETLSVSDVETAGADLVVTATSDNTSLIGNSDITITHDGDGNRTVTVDPKDDQNGSATITVRVTDGNGGYNECTFGVTVEAANDAPVGDDAGGTISEDGAYSVAWASITDDVDIATNGDVLSVAITSAAGHGTAAVDGGNIVYTPSADWNGTDSFVYTVTDSGALSDTGTITVIVSPDNDAPVGDDVSDGINEDTTYTIAWAGITDDPDIVLNGDTLSVSITTAAGHGTAAVDGDNITYTPDANYNGEDSFVYTVTDGSLSDTGTITLEITQVNDAPVAQADSVTTPEETPITIEVLVNDTDVDTIAAVNEDALHTRDDITVLTASAEHGVVQIIEGGARITYTPELNYFGMDSITYTISDGHGGTSSATVSVNVTPVNDAPEIVETLGGITIQEDHSTDTITFTVYDVDDDESTLTATAAHNDTPDGLLQDITVSADGATRTFVVNTNPNKNGSSEITVTVTDAAGLSDTQTFTLTVTQVNDAPVANADSVTTPEETPVTIDVLANDTDVDTIAADNKDALHTRDDITVLTASAEHGNVQIIEGGARITYTPELNYFGADSIDYTISDGHGGTSSATVSVNVTPVNDAPEIVETLGGITILEDHSTDTITFTVYDVDDDESTLTAAAAHNDTPAGLLQDITVSADGATRTFVVNTNPNKNGSSEITVTVTDAAGLTDTQTFTLTVTPVNDAPVGDDAGGTISEDGAYSVAWASITDDVDIATNGDTLSVAITTAAGHGTAAVDGGNIVYTPDADWNGTDSFVYTVTDSGDLSDTGEITVVVTPDNDAPVGDDVSNGIDEDETFTVAWADITDDVDIATNGDTLSVSITGAASHGTAAVDGDNITYTPDANYNGTDSFVYTVTDGSLSDTGTITLAIAQVNDNPNAANDSASTAEDAAVTIDVLANDMDVDTEEALNENARHDLSDLEITDVSDPVNGSVSIVGGQIVYTPNTDFNGTDEFTYTISDGHGGTDSATVRVLVGATNDAPVAKGDAMETAEDTLVSYNVLDNDEDIDGDTLQFVEFTGDVSAYGDISATADGTVTFDPKADWNGSFAVGYRMSDGFAEDTAMITITVTAVNDAPAADGASQTTAEDTPLSIDTAPLISDVDDEDDSNLTVSVESGDGPLHGSVSISGHTITYTPDADYNGGDSFVYTVADNTGLSDTATITIAVTAVNDAPVAAVDNAQTDEDTPVTIDVLANDTDIDTDEALNASPQGPLSIAVSLGTPTHGSVAIVEGRIVYTPDENYNGTDSFTYYATDGALSAQATVSVAIGQINDNPDAADDAAQTTDGDLISIDVLGNDTDKDAVDGLNDDELHSLDDLEITAVSTPAGGTAVINDGRIDYTAGDTFAGVDTFTYDISDGHGGTATATVTVTVLSANDPPDTPVVDTPAGGEKVGGNATITVTWTGFDIDGDALTYILEYFDGTSWHVVETGLTDTTYDFHIPDAQTTTHDLQFRVNANDGEFASDYGYSGLVTVDKDAPMDIVVAMAEADGSTYSEGTWTNQSVTVQATDITDISNVTFSYATEDMDFAPGNDITVTRGVHEVYIHAADEFGNAATFGGYQIRIDKRDPAVPNSTVTLDGTQAVITLAPGSDPGGSGNSYMILPDGSRVAAEDGIAWTTDENGTYAFIIGDVAGNRTTFEVVVDVIDVTPPSISCDAHGYRYGDVSAEDIVAALIFSDSESDIVAKGFAVSETATYSGAYKSYTGDITIGSGQYYIHAFDENAFGLQAFETFGPFIVETPETVPDVGELPPSGDVVVDPGNDGKVRLPGGKWGEELVLEDIAPGVYLVEVMDENGNVSLVEITITDEDIAAGRWNVENGGASPWWLWVLAGAALLILLLLLLFIRNVLITVRGEDGKTIRRIRKLRRRKGTVVVDLSEGKTRGGIDGTVRLAARFTKRMRGNELIISAGGTMVLSVFIPEDADGRFEAKIARF